MMASIIIPTYAIERLKYVEKAVESVLNQGFHDIEIIIVVDCNQELYKILKKKPLKNTKVILSRNKGASYARNCGIKRALGEILVFIDDDIIVEKDWLRYHISNYRDPNVAGVGGMVKPLWEDKIKEEIPKEIYWTIGCTYDSNGASHTIRNVFSGNCSFRKEIFQQLLFPTLFQRSENSLRGTEDTQLCLEIQRLFQNHRIVYEPKAIAYHRILRNKTTLNWLLIRAYSEGLSKAYIARKYPGRKTLSIEKNYLIELLSKSIRKRLFSKSRRVTQNLKQVFLILLVTFGVGIGYFTFRLFGEKNR